MANTNGQAVSQLSQAQGQDPVMSAEVAALRAQLADVMRERDAAVAKAKSGGGRITLKVSEKGALSCYGLGRFPVTLYAGQWERLLSFLGAPAGNPVERFIAEQASKLARKE